MLIQSVQKVGTTYVIKGPGYVCTVYPCDIADGAPGEFEGAIFAI